MTDTRHDRIFKVAKKYGVKNDEIMELLRENNIPFRSHMSMLSSEAMEIIKNHYEGGKKDE